MIDELVKIMAKSHDHLYEGALDILIYLQKSGKLKVSEREIYIDAPKFLRRPNTEECDGWQKSNCCWATIYQDSDICSDCKEHCETVCYDCENICEDYHVLGLGSI